MSPARTTAKQTSRGTTKKASSSASTSSAGLSKEERDAVKEAAAEKKAASRRTGASGKQADERDVLAKIAEMPPKDRALAKKVHAIVTKAAPELAPKTWYGMPAYAKDGKVVLFFQSADKFKSRYATLGFNDPANLDDGTMWPTSFAVTSLSKADEATISALVTKAAS